MASEPIGGLHIQLGAETAKLIQDLGKARSHLNKFSRDAGRGVQGLQKSLSNLGQVATTISGLAIFGGITKGFQGAVRAAVSFETAFTGVRKTVDETEAGFAKLKGRFEDLSTSTGVTFEELSKIGELAGQLGVRGVDNLSKFTETIARISVSTNLTSEQAATNFAQFANVVKLPLDQVDRLGAAIVDLGNNFATTEADISNMSQRLASSGTTLGLTASEILGIATALSSVGIEAEAGGTAFSKVFIKIAEAASRGDQQIARFTGRTVESFKALVQSNPAQAVVEFVESLGRVRQEGGDLFGILDQLDLKEVRLRNALLSTANAGDILRRSVDLSGKAFQENSALISESDKRFKTTEFSMNRLSNAFSKFQATIGNVLTPSINGLVAILIPLITKVGELATEYPNLTKAMVAMAGVVAVGGALLIGLGALGLILTGLGAASGPILAVAGAIVGLTGLFVGLKDEIPGLNDLLGRLKETLKSIFELDFESFNRNMKAILGGDFTDDARLNKLREQRKLILGTITEMESSLRSGGEKAFFGLLDTGLKAKIDMAKKELANIDDEINDIIAKRSQQAETKQKKAEPVKETRRALSFAEGPSVDQQSSAELAALMARNEATIKLIQAEEEFNEVKSDRVRVLQEENALLQEAATLQKEAEDAKKDGRAVDASVGETAAIERMARLRELQNERVKLEQEYLGILQEIEGADIQHKLNLDQQTQRQQVLNQFTKEQRDIQRTIDQAGDDTSKVRAGQILLVQSRINLIKKENETLGETKARNEQILQLQMEINDLREEGNRIQQEALGRGIVAGASADLEKQLADRRRAVRDAEHQLELGSIARGQTRQDQRVREIQLIEAKLQLLYEEQRLGLVNTEQANNQFDVLVTEFNNASNPQGFLEGWQNAFQQFSDDAQGAFGLGQTLARQFTQNVQQLGASITQNVFNKLEEGTLTWRSALETIPDILQQITSQLIGMAIAQGVASAIGGGLGGLFGGGAPGATPNATARGAMNPNLFGPGFANGTDFIVKGRSGVDANFLPMRLSNDERVRVETPAQQREGRGGGEMTVNIFNTAGVDVTQQERQTPNGSVLDVMIARKVRDVNKREFGLATKPGRTG